MRCQEFREMMDSYLSDELLVETNHEVLHHLENCRACRDELAARRALLAQMRSAVKNAPEMQLNSAFAIKLKNDLRETALRPSVRHDIYLLFEVTNGNPNGDPDAGNMPRIEPNTGRGIVSDVCLKRKVRNYIEMFRPERNGNAYEIFIKSGDALEKAITRAELANDNNASETVKWLCREFYDIRAFGGVLSTGSGVMKGSSYGQVRGPVQLTFSQSFHPHQPA
ncbi:MAG TPA: type I CRISPR-associated protein Cas7 [Pyrinomonadaceae bacterium]|nr:type I CRISPR-associated protein Cas7 [Pyrinomonadaceae bacterium]